MIHRITVNFWHDRNNEDIHIYTEQRGANLLYVCLDEWRYSRIHSELYIPYRGDASVMLSEIYIFAYMNAGITPDVLEPYIATVNVGDLAASIGKKDAENLMPLLAI